MLQYILWVVSFFTLWLAVVWLNFMLESKKPKTTSRQPVVSVGIPCFNRADTLAKTVASLFELDYPKDKLDVIVVDDCSTDSTVKVAMELKKIYPIRVICHKKNLGAGGALNTALKHAKGELFARIDSDSRVEPGCLKQLVKYLVDDNIGAVIPIVKVDEPANFIEKMQNFEYVMSSMTRKIMSNLGTLSINGGVLPVFRTAVLRKLGGFDADRNNLTEDLEMALRLKKAGFDIYLCNEGVGYTTVPSSFGSLWRQRVRWCRGYIFNHWKYRSMLFDMNRGLFGMFQMPVNILIVALLVVHFSIISYGSLSDLYSFFQKSFSVPNYFWDVLFSWPSFKEFLLAKNFQIIVPIFVAYFAGVYLIFRAHRFFGERVKSNIFSIVVYFLTVPYFSAANWVNSLFKELVGAKRKW